jgi:hypothetical protein
MHNMLISAGITSGKKINVLPTIVVAPAAPAEALAKEESATENTPDTQEETVPPADAEALAGKAE